MTEYFIREIEPLLQLALGELPVVVVTGMRQTGKSTLLQKCPAFKDRCFVSLDDFATLEAAIGDPRSFLTQHRRMTIDEAQKHPPLLNEIKRLVDQKRQNGNFLLSGSANYSLLSGISESLAGRAVYFSLQPFTRRETQKKTVRSPFLKQFIDSGGTLNGIKEEFVPIEPKEVLIGGFPSLCLAENLNPFFWFKGYEQTYLERDIRDISRISNLLSFRNLLKLTMHRIGKVLNFSELGRDAKLNTPSTINYFSHLEASFVAQRLLPFLRNPSSRLIKSPKVYCGDSGLGAYLTGTKGQEDPFYGAIFENFVHQNIAGILCSTMPEAQVYFWNVQGRHEVDFVIQEGNRCLAIEIKSGARWNDNDLKSLKAFLAATQNCMAGIIAHNGVDWARLGEKLWAVPVSQLIS